MGLGTTPASATLLIHIQIHIQTSAEVPGDPSLLLQALSCQPASLLGKPENTVMMLRNTGMAMTFAGEANACADVVIKSNNRSLGGNRPDDRSNALVCTLLESHLSITAERIFSGV